MQFLNKKVALSVSLASLAGFANLACQAPAGNGAANTAVINTSPNSVANSVNTATAIANSVINVPTGAAIDAKEPEKYQATVLLKLETTGAQNNSPFPPIKAEVARSGNDRRMEFKMPTGETVIYLDKGGRQILISPQRKQYAELNKEAVGFEVRRLLMPEQIVNQLKNMKGVEQVGEEKIDGRDAVKYRFASTTNTQSQAGKVNTESFIFVDKETGLPLRSFTNAAAQGSVQGVNAVNLVTEINNIKTDVDANLFNEPTDFAKVAPEQIRSQINAIFSVAAAVIGNMMKSVQAETPTPVPSTTPTP
jgi:hypothetical protein